MNKQEWEAYETEINARCNANPGKAIRMRAGLYRIALNGNLYTIEYWDKFSEYTSELNLWHWHSNDYDNWGIDFSDGFHTLKEAVVNLTEGVCQ